jgi:hypothetical protein
MQPLPEEVIAHRATDGEPICHMELFAAKKKLLMFCQGTSTKKGKERTEMLSGKALNGKNVKDCLACQARNLASCDAGFFSLATVVPLCWLKLMNGA